MTPLVLSSLLLITAYTAVVSYKSGGIPSSISATFYRLKHPYWFCAVMWLTAGLLMPAILEVSTPGTEWIAFLGCAGMLLVGVAPNFREEFEGKVHMGGAVLCLGGSQIWVAFNCPWVLLLWIVYIVYTVVMMVRSSTGNIALDFLKSKPLFWVENISILNTYITLFIIH